MLCWCQNSGVGQEDDIFTRVSSDSRGVTRKRSLLSKDVNSAMSETIALLGLHPRFALSHGKCSSCHIEQTKYPSHIKLLTKSSFNSQVKLSRKKTGLGYSISSSHFKTLSADPGSGIQIMN